MSGAGLPADIPPGFSCRADSRKVARAKRAHPTFAANAIVTNDREPDQVRTRLVWGFFCQTVVLGLLSVLCSEREGRSSSRRLRSGSRSARKGSRDRNASGAWRLAA